MDKILSMFKMPLDRCSWEGAVEYSKDGWKQEVMINRGRFWRRSTEGVVFGGGACLCFFYFGGGGGHKDVEGLGEVR